MQPPGIVQHLVGSYPHQGAKCGLLWVLVNIPSPSQESRRLYTPSSLALCCQKLADRRTHPDDSLMIGQLALRVALTRRREGNALCCLVEVRVSLLLVACTCGVDGLTFPHPTLGAHAQHARVNVPCATNP
jgi:hypothetical protein